MSDDYERKSDVIIEGVRQRLEDHIAEFSNSKKMLIEWQQDHIEWCKAEIARIETDMFPMKTAFRKFETPVRWIGWIVIGTVTGSLLWIGDKFMAFIARHWGP